MSLNNLAATMSELGRREKARAAAEEAADLYRVLAAVRPEAFTPNLAVSLNTLSYVLWGLGRRAEALVAAVEAQALSRRSVSGKMTRGSRFPASGFPTDFAAGPRRRPVGVAFAGGIFRHGDAEARPLLHALEDEIDPVGIVLRHPARLASSGFAQPALRPFGRSPSPILGGGKPRTANPLNGGSSSGRKTFFWAVSQNRKTWPPASPTSPVRTPIT